jgi:hypothetical protein
LKLCDELYQLAEEQSECVLTVSQDQFHREMHTINLNKFQDSEWGEDRPYFHHEIRKGDIMEPLAEGRAAMNGLGWKDPVIQKPWKVREEDGEELEIYEGEVYVSANGNVTSACDMSYARVDTESKGNILITCLADIVRGFCVKEEEQVSATA